MPLSAQVLAPSVSGRLKTMCAKTKMCKFFAQGECKKGQTCAFAHSEAELREEPNLRSTKACPTLASTGTCSNPKCLFAHAKRERREVKFPTLSGKVVQVPAEDGWAQEPPCPPPQPWPLPPPAPQEGRKKLWKTQMCTFYEHGQCRKTPCGFAHGEQELKARQELRHNKKCPDGADAPSIRCDLLEPMWLDTPPHSPTVQRQQVGFRLQLGIPMEDDDCLDVFNSPPRPPGSGASAAAGRATVSVMAAQAGRRNGEWTPTPLQMTYQQRWSTGGSTSTEDFDDEVGEEAGACATSCFQARTPQVRRPKTEEALSPAWTSPGLRGREMEAAAMVSNHGRIGVQSQHAAGGRLRLKNTFIEVEDEASEVWTPLRPATVSDRLGRPTCHRFLEKGECTEPLCRCCHLQWR